MPLSSHLETHLKMLQKNYFSSYGQDLQKLEDQTNPEEDPVTEWKNQLQE
jgi:hypothetical protein